MAAVAVPALGAKSRLHSLIIRDAEFVTDDDSGQEVYHVCDPHALIQAAGYLKFIFGKAPEGIFFRGQTKLYPALSPTLFRTSKSRLANSRRLSRLRESLDAIAEERIFRQVGAYAVEPLLQHYGFRTTWIDLVDNVWVALWFACHHGRTTGKLSEYLHFERRNPSVEGEKFAYILLVGTGITPSPTSPGLYSGAHTELIDLRVACPSIFIRPHAQHGVLFRVRGVGGAQRPIDYSTQLRGIIRIRLDDALTWLGDGKMLGIHALFPPPFYDTGYSVLLGARQLNDPMIGAIAHVGA